MNRQEIENRILKTKNVFKLVHLQNQRYEVEAREAETIAIETYRHLEELKIRYHECLEAALQKQSQLAESRALFDSVVKLLTKEQEKLDKLNTSETWSHVDSQMHQSSFPARQIV